jgi:multicomponent Na+:H+ antiporter subunit B
MSALWLQVPLGSAAVDIGTPLVFDVGVFLAVVGVVVTIVFTLAETVLLED